MQKRQLIYESNEFYRCRVCRKETNRVVVHDASCSETCDLFIERARSQIHGAQYRARKIGVASDLTVGQWFYTLRYFHFKCAYCQKAPYQSIDHFVPLAAGGATEFNNCVPACIKCNSKKGDFYGEALRYMFGDNAYYDISDYLATHENHHRARQR